jgi:hypothetical protein
VDHGLKWTRQEGKKPIHETIMVIWEMVVLKQWVTWTEKQNDSKLFGAGR